MSSGFALDPTLFDGSRIPAAVRALNVEIEAAAAGSPLLGTYKPAATRAARTALSCTALSCTSRAAWTSKSQTRHLRSRKPDLEVANPPRQASKSPGFVSLCPTYPSERNAWAGSRPREACP
jgi:hypothetical protein